MKNRFTYPPQVDDLEIVAFHRTGELKSLRFLYRERESLNLGFIYVGAPFFLHPPAWPRHSGRREPARTYSSIRAGNLLVVFYLSCILAWLFQTNDGSVAK